MDIVEGVLLSSWNCILGPKVECLWIPNSNPVLNLYESSSFCHLNYSSSNESVSSNDFYTHVVNDNLPADYIMPLESSSDVQISSQTQKIRKVLKICGQLLIGEAEQNQLLQSKSRLFVSEDSRLIITSVLFHKMPYVTAERSHNREGVWFCLALFFRFSELKAVLDMRYVIDLHLRKAAEAIEKIPIPQGTPVKDISAIMQDLFSSVNFLACCSRKPEQVHLAKLCNSADRVEFISKAISSHIQTGCVSVVIGNSEYFIRQVIHLLMAFSGRTEKYSFQPIDKKSSLLYLDGISVQGFIADINQTVNILSKLDACQSPVTVIDTVNQIVQKFHIMRGYDAEENRCSLEIITDGGVLIHEILEKVLLLIKNGEDPLSSVNELCKLFKVKAAALLKITRKGTYAVPSKLELMTMLQLHKAVDLQVVLGYAEKLRPGISSLIR